MWPPKGWQRSGYPPRLCFHFRTESSIPLGSSLGSRPCGSASTAGRRGLDPRRPTRTCSGGGAKTLPAPSRALSGQTRGRAWGRRGRGRGALTPHCAGPLARSRSRRDPRGVDTCADQKGGEPARAVQVEALRTTRKPGASFPSRRRLLFPTSSPDFSCRDSGGACRSHGFLPRGRPPAAGRPAATFPTLDTQGKNRGPGRGEARTADGGGKASGGRRRRRGQDSLGPA